MANLGAHRADMMRFDIPLAQKLAGDATHMAVAASARFSQLSSGIRPSYNGGLHSLGEVAFRLRQEVRNLDLWARPPRIDLDGAFARRLPWLLADAVPADEIISLAERICRHEFPIFGGELATGPAIRWRRDYARDIETPLNYFRRIPYLDTARAGDHKFIWELNRHQHLVTLAQAFLLTGDDRLLTEIQTQLASWIDQNPLARGINWASGLEVAFRSLSWMWVDYLVGDRLSSRFRREWLGQLYLHGCYLENNLSVYFSPNTHLLGEALALHALGIFFNGDRRGPRWQSRGAQVMRDQLDAQVRADGSHVEQSSYYHVYALDMFLLHATLIEPEPVFIEKLSRMENYLDALRGPSGKLPLMGDDDGGRLMPASLRLSRTSYERTGSLTSRFFPEAGIAVMVADRSQIIVDAGPFGPWSSGHSHADVLSIVARAGAEEVLIDPGTFTYTGDARWRDWFRGTSAHNTVTVDGRNHATADGPFRWCDPPGVRVNAWESSSGRDRINAECRYAGFTHRRSVIFDKPDLVTVVDDISGPPGEHRVEQWWHLGSMESRSRLQLPEGAELVQSWRSPSYGVKVEAPAIRVRRTGTLPIRLEAKLRLTPP